MADHPCKDLTQAQRDAFEQIAINQPPQCGWKSIDALLKAGVIERGEDDVRKDAMGIYRIPRFTIPLSVQMQWCAWCSENVPDNASCAKCGCDTRGEAALVSGQTWCHPCADVVGTPLAPEGRK